ncbi:MAG: hypothetical protein H9893_09710 [Candidatus Niameybacter stercoravium]|nr:hypothetical protein [Candidatus Niameybacter stercoravium]
MIKFRRLSQDEFERYKAYSVQDYAQDLIRSGNETEESALESSINEFNELFRKKWPLFLTSSYAKHLEIRDMEHVRYMK